MSPSDWAHKTTHLFRFIYSHTHTRKTTDTVQIIHHSTCALKTLFFDVDVELRVHSLTKSCITLVERTEEVH